MARGPDGPLLVPFTLPGELVSVAAEPGENHAKSLAILEPSGERVAPVCPHFAPAAAAPFSVWRPVPTLPGSASRVVGALGSRGLEAPVEEVRPVPRSAGGARPSLLSALGKACPSATALRVRMRSSTSLRVQPPHLRPPAKAQGCTGAAAWREARSARHRHGDRPGPRRGCRGCARGPASSEQTCRGERNAWCGKVPSPLSADSPAPVRMTMLRNLVIRLRAKVTRVFPSP